MEIIVRAGEEKDMTDMIRIWNEVVEDGTSFPQEEFLTLQSRNGFFASQTYNGVAADQETGRVLGLYILHPNNVGRCGHICNASYAVSRESRGLHIGENWFWTVWSRGVCMVIGCCSSMQWWPLTSTPAISMNALALSSWARSPEGSA